MGMVFICFHDGLFMNIIFSYWFVVFLPLTSNFYSRNLWYDYKCFSLVVLFVFWACGWYTFFWADYYILWSHFPVLFYGFWILHWNSKALFTLRLQNSFLLFLSILVAFLLFRSFLGVECDIGLHLLIWQREPHPENGHHRTAQDQTDRADHVCSSPLLSLKCLLCHTWRSLSSLSHLVSFLHFSLGNILF